MKSTGGHRPPLQHQRDNGAFSCHLSLVTCRFILVLVLEGRRIASGASWKRKVRTPKGAMPRNPGCLAGIDAGGKLKDFSTESATENRPPAFALTSYGAARVKRCGKSAPRFAQARRHGKPHRVQGQIGNPGAARSRFRESETGSGYRLQRQMILSAARRRQNSAYSPSKTIFLAYPWRHSFRNRVFQILNCEPFLR